MARSRSKLSKVNVGVIGVGIGRLHIQAYTNCPDSRVVAICDINEERGTRVASEFGVTDLYKDYREMLARPDIDAISVCTPNYLHAPMTIDAFEAGKHVICEKPLTIDPKDGEAMVAAAKKAGKTFMTAFNNRFRGDTQLLKQFIENGDLGEIYYAKTGWLRRKGIPGMGSWFTSKKLAGGGPLIDLGVHVLDLTLWLMGNPKAVSVSGATYAKFGVHGEGMGTWGHAEEGGTCDVEDLATGFVRLENGATVIVEASWASHVKEEVVYTNLVGTKGGADLVPFGIYKDMRGATVDITPTFPNVSGHEREVWHFVDCLVKGKEPISTGEHGLEVVKILNALYKSAKTGREVVLK